jgi:hypothetical protein
MKTLFIILLPKMVQGLVFPNHKAGITLKFAHPAQRRGDIAVPMDMRCDKTYDGVGHASL